MGMRTGSGEEPPAGAKQRRRDRSRDTRRTDRPVPPVTLQAPAVGQSLGGQDEGAGRRVGLGGQVEPLHGGQDARARSSPRSRRVEQQQPVHRVGEVAARRAGRRACGSSGAGPTSWRGCAGRAGRCGRPPRAGPGRRAAPRSCDDAPDARAVVEASPPRRACGEACASTCREMTRSARGVVGERRPLGRVGPAPRPRVRQTVAPAAASRPSMREARSKTRSASVVSPSVRPRVGAAVAGVDDDPPADQVRSARPPSRRSAAAAAAGRRPPCGRAGAAPAASPGRRCRRG